MKIDQEAAEKIVIVPAGYYSEPHLSVCKYWLSNLWNHCFAAISTQEGQLAFLKANFHRLKNEADEDKPTISLPGTSKTLWYYLKKTFKR